MRALRDSVIHLEELVLDGCPLEGSPFALKVDGLETLHPTDAGQTTTIDRVIIGQNELLFVDSAA